MIKAKKHLQIRRCALCNKVGHNKKTCPHAPIAPLTANHPHTVNFFVHHVAHDPEHSPHVLNLKQEQHPVQTWQQIQPIAPEKSDNPSYHYYHRHQPLFDVAQKKPQANQHNIAAGTNSTRSPLQPRQHYRLNIMITARAVLFKIRQLTRILTRNVQSHIQLKLKILRLPTLKKAWIVTLMLIALIVPGPTWGYYQNLKNTTKNIATNGTAGFVALQDSTAALMQSDMSTAQTSLTEALKLFDQAVDTMNKKYHLLQNIAAALPIIGDEVTSRQKLVIAGQQLALGNHYLLDGLTASQTAVSSTLTERAHIIVTHLHAAIPNYEKAITNLNDVKTDILPLQYQTAFVEYQKLFTVILSDMRKLAILGDTIQEIFGGKGLRRYLLIFQNIHEMRPTGGFMGSFAILTIQDGEILKLEVPPNGTYDLKKQLDVYVEPPRPLLLTNKRWEFQDANWFPDFSASAEKILWFYQHSRQETADGVIAINSTVLERILSIIGPITDTKRGLVLNQNNAIEIIQKKTETWDEEKKDFRPKQIITDLAVTFLDYFKNIQADNLLPILTQLQEALEQKEIQAYFTDNRAEKAIGELGWDGKIITTNPEQDYLLVINTNVQGQKTDAKIKQTISHQALINDDGTITNTVTITRTHTGTNDQGLYGSANINYLRLYVPAGSELISASGFIWPDEKYFRVPAQWTKKDPLLAQLETEIKVDNDSGTRITREFDKTAFGNWIITEPGQTTQVEFVYRLPHRFFIEQDKSFWEQPTTARYQLIAQRQSGSETDFESQIILPKNWTPIWQDGHSTAIAANGLVIKPQPLQTDRIWSLIARQK